MEDSIESQNVDLSPLITFRTNLTLDAEVWDGIIRDDEACIEESQGDHIGEGELCSE